MSNEGSTQDRTNDTNLFYSSPYNQALGLRPLNWPKDGCVLCLPYQAHLVGDLDSGAVHAGAISGLIDTTFGQAVYTCIPRVFATLDLRIDHIRRSTAGRDLICAAACYKHTAQLAFVRGSVYHDDPADPIATAVAIFMFTDAVQQVFAAGRSHEPG